MTIKKTFLLILLLPFISGCFGDSATEPTATTTLTPTNTPTLEQIPPTQPAATVEILETSPPTAIPTQTATMTPTTAPCQRPFGWVDYTVQPGDTLSALGRQTNSSIQEIKNVNCLTRNIIYINEILFLPQLPGSPVPATTAVIFATNTATAELPPPITSTPTRTPSPTNTAEAPPSSDPTATYTPTPTSTAELPPPGGPGDPRLLITPYSGPIGTVYTVTLENYDPNDTVTIEIFFTGSSQIVFTSSTIVDGMGNGTFQFYTEPGDEPGLYILKATGSDGSPSLSGEFQIDP